MGRRRGERRERERERRGEGKRGRREERAARAEREAGRSYSYIHVNVCRMEKCIRQTNKTKRSPPPEHITYKCTSIVHGIICL